MASSGKFVSEVKRTHYCGEVNKSDSGQEIVVMGWVETRRDHGGLIFVDLRDREGIVQVVLDPAKAETANSKNFRNEFVVAVKGLVRERPDGMINKNLKTGEIELEAQSCEILSEALTPPFQISDENVSENIRLQYRYLDLRTQRLQNSLIMRHKVTKVARDFLSEEGFYEIETPILYKSTPEGARDYLVPSRVNQGSFYALPQSPQTLKQLLMVGGFDKYFQIARCFRDEDLRADRQPEFSQIDIEMSFVDQDDVMALNEKLAKYIWKNIKGVEIKDIPRLTYTEAMDRFGCDKPDLRISLELKTITEVVINSGFKVFDDVAKNGGSIRALAVPGVGGYSRGQFDKLTTLAKQNGAKGLVYIKNQKGELSSPIAKFFDPEKFKEIFNAAGGVEDGAVFVVADDYEVSCAALSALRLHLAKELNLIDISVDKFLWVTDFPLFMYDNKEHRWVASHHPFTCPSDEDEEKLTGGNEKEFGNIKAKAYDFVCNGHEIAGGSVRIHKSEVQSAMFNALKLTPEDIKIRFGFFVEALKYGTPPHGGVAWGLDRLVMILAGTDAIRDVIAFPKTAKATDIMSDAPNTVDQSQLLELGIRLNKPKN
ncbi:aspartate--tRNA ligase [bacterium]|nr:aspartate--tRNA ligase [bacterium]